MTVTLCGDEEGHVRSHGSRGDEEGIIRSHSKERKSASGSDWVS